jgi:DNA topoisomerase-1
MGARGANSRNGKSIEPAVATDSVEAAEEAGLRYVNDEQPGYSRRAKGKNFEYLDTEGKAIRDEQRLLRIKRLAIPPAWTGVWICPSPNGHIQATGRDARGRKQYRYHDRWREVRDENKFDRLGQFAKALPSIRRRVAQDLKLPGLPRQKVLATIVRLLERTFIRVGNEEYARENKSFGLTTLKNRHVKVKGAQVRFRFRGKSGRQHEVDVDDRRVAKVIAKCQDLPGQDLFQYLEEGEEVRDVTSQDVNDYLPKSQVTIFPQKISAPGVARYWRQSRLVNRKSSKRRKRQRRISKLRFARSQNFLATHRRFAVSAMFIR